MMKTTNRPWIWSKVRSLFFLTAVCTLAISTENHTFAEPSAQTPPEMLSYNTLELPDGRIFEHGDNSLSYAAVQGDQIVVKTIGAYGQIKPALSFSKQKLEYISDFHQTGNGYIAAGGSYLLKVSSTGQMEWDYSSQDSGSIIKSVDQLTDGSYIAAITVPGSVTNTSSLHLIHLSSSGDMIREKDLDPLLFDSIHSISHASDGGFIVSGESYIDGDKEDIFLAKFDASGDAVWQQSLAPAEDTQNLWVTSTAEDQQGNIVVAGFYNHPNPDGGYRYLTTGYVLRVDHSGAKQWLQVLDPSLDRSMLNDIQPTESGGYVVTGTVNQDWHGTVSRQFAWKLSDDGNTEWKKIINRTTFNAGEIVQALHNDQYLLIGTADGSSTLIKLGTVNNK